MTNDYAEISVTEHAALRIQLSLLDEFDPRGLMAWNAAGAMTDYGPVVEVERETAETKHGVGVFERDEEGNPDVVWRARSDLYVDLAHDEVADRVARWLLMQLFLPASQCTAPTWFPKLGPIRWLLRCGHTTRLFVASMPSRIDSGDMRNHWDEVPSLADIDPWRDRRVVDGGARYANRLALARVAVHVAAKVQAETAKAAEDQR